MSRILETPSSYLCFHRLAIMGNEAGMQPFHLDGDYDGDYAVCNGEIYGFRAIKEKLAKYAREVADYIGAGHTEVYMTLQQVLGSLEEVIALLGTWDITTIRASMGMYLYCKAIREQTDARILLTDEISDELFSYKYTDFISSDEAFQKRVDELYLYDVLRADRCISVNSIEGRVPFGTGAVRGPHYAETEPLL